MILQVQKIIVISIMMILGIKLKLQYQGKYGLITEQDEYVLYKALRSVIENAVLRSDLRNKALERARLFNESAIMDQIYTVLG